MSNIPNITHPGYAYLYAKKYDRRIPKLEPVIMKDPEYIYYYARDVIKGRWYEAEPVIMTDLWKTFFYVRDVIKGRWPEAESIILKSPECACAYARAIIKDRWSEAEPIMVIDGRYLEYYMSKVLGNRNLNLT